MQSKIQSRFQVGNEIFDELIKVLKPNQCAKPPAETFKHKYNENFTDLRFPNSIPRPLASPNGPSRRNRRKAVDLFGGGYHVHARW